MPSDNVPESRLGSPESDLRFKGLSRSTRDFFTSLEAAPCPPVWPGGDRVAYAAHVLSPFKALVADLDRLLSYVTPPLGLEPRVGRSLYWSGPLPPCPGDCPVRQIRVWDARRAPEESPALYATFSRSGIEVGLAAAGGDPEATRRLTDALREEKGSEIRGRADDLLARGWVAEGETADADRGDARDGDIRPWAWERGLRVYRTLDWNRWIDEPGFVVELADLFRELLPLFDRMREARAAPPRRASTAACPPTAGGR